MVQPKVQRQQLIILLSQEDKRLVRYFRRNRKMISAQLTVDRQDCRGGFVFLQFSRRADDQNV